MFAAAVAEGRRSRHCVGGGLASIGQHAPTTTPSKPEAPHNLGYPHRPALKLHRFLYLPLKGEPYKKGQLCDICNNATTTPWNPHAPTNLGYPA